MCLVVDPSMEDLPVPLMVDILPRLPVKTIIHCKCVCKKWLNIVLEPYFADLQLSRSPAGFMIKKSRRILKWVEVEDELDHHNLHHDPVMSLDLNLAPILQKPTILSVGSVDGLLCLWQFSRKLDNLKYDYTYICNPITREYMILHTQQCYIEGPENVITCFGVGSLTREYKVIRIFEKLKKPDVTSTVSEAKVYTLGTGQWRSLGHVPYWFNEWNGTFLKGHAHWNLVYDKNLPETLCAFDFDKETFEFFPSPPYEEAIEERQYCFPSLGVLKGCLCRHDQYDSNLTVWMMKEYGIKNSWHKELVIKYSTIPDLNMSRLKPWYLIQGYKDGTILMTSPYGGELIIYCPRTNTVVELDMFECLDAFVYHPSFHRLHNFENERVLRSTQAPL